jgi:hypothetical protein
MVNGACLRNVEKEGVIRVAFSDQNLITEWAREKWAADAQQEAGPRSRL